MASGQASELMGWLMDRRYHLSSLIVDKSVADVLQMLTISITESFLAGFVIKRIESVP